jgi:hypothetical protein
MIGSPATWVEDIERADEAALMQVNSFHQPARFSRENAGPTAGSQGAQVRMEWARWCASAESPKMTGVGGGDIMARS